MKDTLLYGLLGSFITAGLTFLGNAMGWIRFKKKDKAEAQQLDAVKEKTLSDAALEWTRQLAARLDIANQVIDKRQEEIEKLHLTIDTMKKEFEASIIAIKKEFDNIVESYKIRVRELEACLDTTMDELKQEREINQREMDEILKNDNRPK